MGRVTGPKFLLMLSYGEFAAYLSEPGADGVSIEQFFELFM